MNFIKIFTMVRILVMDLIKRYELKYIGIEEFKEAIQGAVSESLEEKFGYDCLCYYVGLANETQSYPFFINNYRGDFDGNVERKCD